MNDLRIVFMGTPAFAVASLEALLRAKMNVVAVVTAPDKPAGRGRNLKQSAVKEYALKRNLPVLQPNNLKADHFVQELINLKVNLQIVVAFRMLPKVVWSLPNYGTFNLHASLLPHYRGAAPINWAIINGEKKTGVTTFFLNENIDEGAIILQQEVDIDKNETAGDLHDKLMLTGSKLVIETVQLIASEKVFPKKQSNESFKLAPKLTSENCRIDWSQDVYNVFNQVRGLSPYPLAHTLLVNGDEQIKTLISSCTPFELEHIQNFGSILIKQKEIQVFCKNGFIKIDQLKLAGKKLMDAKSLLNGYTILDGAHFE
ncbi:methionyl-tRNA formyltransferase [Namhaeicola litoreus]|uniref:Methionyl-tRNA formyltransferase n=1 Tax=Namhaeicola litoreus TaxID=1052145 RepID=A0ABW3Y6F1_9FLAO